MRRRRRGLDPIYTHVGMMIRLAREDSSMSQLELAERIGVVRSSISNMEAGCQRFALDVLKQIAEVLGCNMKDFLPE